MVFGTIWRIITWGLVALVFGPPLLGIALVYTQDVLPPFAPTDHLSKIGYGTFYGYYEAYVEIGRLLGFESGVLRAKDVIVNNGTLPNVVDNLTAYPEYANMSLELDSWFDQFSAYGVDQLYHDYGSALGLNVSYPWSLDFYVVPHDGSAVIADLYIDYFNSTFAFSKSPRVATQSPHFGIIVSEDVYVAITSIARGDINEIPIYIIRLARQVGIVIWTYNKPLLVGQIHW